MSQEQKDLLKRLFKVSQYKVDLYHLFYEKAINLLKKNGHMCFITPISFLKNVHNDKLRGMLVNQTIIKIIVRFLVPVFDASVDNAIILCRKGYLQDNSFFTIDIKDNISNILSNRNEVHLFQQSQIVAPKYSFDLDVADDNIILKKMESFYMLKDFAKTYFGIQTYDRKLYVSKVMKNSNFVPVIDGTNVKFYQLLSPKEYVLFIPSAIKSGGNPSVYTQDRIVVRQIGLYPEGCLCPSGIYTLNTIYNIYLWNNKLSLKYILGLVNSKLLHYYWILKNSDSKKTFPKIKKAPLDSLPIAFNEDSATRKSIEKLVSNIIAAKSDISISDTSADEQEIDRLVYHLYGLTYDEVKIVDPMTTITEEDYNQQ